MLMHPLIQVIRVYLTPTSWGHQIQLHPPVSPAPPDRNLKHSISCGAQICLISGPVPARDAAREPDLASGDQRVTGDLGARQCVSRSGCVLALTQQSPARTPVFIVAQNLWLSTISRPGAIECTSATRLPTFVHLCFCTCSLRSFSAPAASRGGQQQATAGALQPANGQTCRAPGGRIMTISSSCF